MFTKIHSEVSEEEGQHLTRDKVIFFNDDNSSEVSQTQRDGVHSTVDMIVEDDDNISAYSDSDIKDIFDECVKLGVCCKHETNLTILMNTLRDTEDVYIANLCHSINRNMWWNSSTPLMIACLEGGSTLVKVLLLLGADVCATNELKSTGT